MFCIRLEPSGVRWYGCNSGDVREYVHGCVWDRSKRGLRLKNGERMGRGVASIWLLKKDLWGRFP